LTTSSLKYTKLTLKASDVLTEDATDVVSMTSPSGSKNGGGLAFLSLGSFSKKSFNVVGGGGTFFFRTGISYAAIAASYF
jgi:hypothetical protein